MIRSRSLVIALLITFLSATGAFAQKKQKKDAKGMPCPVQSAPAMRGFQLGMLLTDVKGALEDASIFDSKISGGNSVGSRAVRLQGFELKGDNAEGVDDVDLVFVDNRLSHFKVNFNSGMRFDSATDFFTKMSETLGLPRPAGEEQERGSNQRNQKYTVECGAFSVTLAYSFGVTPSVAVTDTRAQKLVGERRENSDEGEIKTIRITPSRPPVSNPPPQPTGNPGP